MKRRGKMRKFMFLTALALVCVMGMAVNGYADQYDLDEGINVETINYENSPLGKIGRGLINLATCWVEIPASMCRVSKKNDPAVGISLGTAEGVCNTLLRGATGVYDTVTFVVPEYDKPVMQPEYALTSADKAFKEYLW
jgi:putative exosortase-associated protein (TIGR04073 family)